jgi:hypothetical protein
VLAAATSEERLKTVREVREQQWFEQLPRSQREQWKAAPEADRRRLLEQWRQEELSGREDWAEARRVEAMTRDRPFMALVSQEGFRREVQTFVEKRLLPQLTQQEKAQLRPHEAEPRRWLPWLRAVAELAERHPALALEPKYTRKFELPAEYRKALDEPARFNLPLEQVRELTPGKWPDFPIKVTRLLRGKIPFKTQLGPATARDISPEVERFVQALPRGDQDLVKKEEGKWPEYPQALHRLARERKLALPDLGLPGDPRLWDAIRKRPANPLPHPPEKMLREFALELNKNDADGPRLSLQDPHDREIIIRRFLEKYPDWRRKLEQQDRTKTAVPGPQP